jgi:hypothetical protein
MSPKPLSPGRRSFLATAATASAVGALPATLLAGSTTEKVNTMNPHPNTTMRSVRFASPFLTRRSRTSDNA